VQASAGDILQRGPTGQDSKSPMPAASLPHIPHAGSIKEGPACLVKPPLARSLVFAELKLAIQSLALGAVHACCPHRTIPCHMTSLIIKCLLCGRHCARLEIQVQMTPRWGEFGALCQLRYFLLATLCSSNRTGTLSYPPHTPPTRSLLCSTFSHPLTYLALPCSSVHFCLPRRM
jgi:hypothetical protein